jgi:hypothetical protein
VILAILAGVIVGVADGVVVWVYVDRLDRGRREARERGVEMSKGSGRLDGDRGTRVDGGDEPKGKDEDRRSGEGVMPEKREVRLRRRALRDEARQDEP